MILPPMILLGLTIVLPLVLALACLSPRVRDGAVRWLVVAPLPGLAAALFAQGTELDLPPVLLRLRLALDQPGAILLGAAGLLWVAGGAYAAAWLRDDPRRGRIAVWWLLTLAGSLGVFMAADLVGFYLLFSLVSLAAWGLVVEGRSPDAPRVGMVYVAMAVFGEALLLFAFVMLAEATAGESLLIRDAVAALPGAPRCDTIMALLVLGFGVKLGMVPFQFWMPLTYRTAPIPAAAVLSGAAVKAGVIGLIRFLPLGTALPGWGEAMMALGFASAFLGAIAGLRQSDPRSVLAFSSISQMGVVTAVFGMGVGAGMPGVAWAAALYGAHHTLVKGGLFLAVGMALRGGGVGPRLLVPAAILALGMAGLPFSGGYIAKLAIKPVLGEGAAGTLGAMSSVATALLMTHFLFRLSGLARREGRAGLALPWLAVAVASVGRPWSLYGSAALSATALLAAMWPVAAGVGLGLAWRQWGKLARRDGGVVLAVSGRAWDAALAIGAATERAEAVLRTWPVALGCLLATAIGLAALMRGGG